MRFLILLLAACAWLLAGCAWAQTADSALTFDAASVKVTGAADAGPVTMRGRPGGGSARQGPDPILFARRRATLATLLMTAYGLRGQQIVGPDWLTTGRYDIEARVPEGATAAQQLIMLQNLLAERFGVKQHREPRELAIYEMVVAKGGSKLKAPGTQPLREMQVMDSFQLTQRDGLSAVRVNARGSLETLAGLLSRQADRLILDRTGLKGEFDIDLVWSLGGGETSSPEVASAPGMDLNKAVEMQLGLRLEAKKEAVEVMVVDRALKVPTEN